jgi:hypothetical protein
MVNLTELSAVVSFARHGRSRPQSFPRKRESTPQTFGNALSADWIPAFAGMTGDSRVVEDSDLPGVKVGGYALCKARSMQGLWIKTSDLELSGDEPKRRANEDWFKGRSVLDPPGVCGSRTSGHTMGAA